MTTNLGDITEDSTVSFLFSTNDGSGGSVAPSGAFDAADLRIYKDGSATQKATANGVTMTSPFDSVVGLHQVIIDLSDDTGDAGFWAAGSDYEVVLTPDETVDDQTVVAVLARFSIENRSVNVARWNGTDVTTDGTSTKPQVDVYSVSGDAIAADNIEATYDGTGYSDDDGPATAANQTSIISLLQSGVSVSYSRPTWNGTSWTEPIIAGDSYIDNGSQDSRLKITISNYTGRALSAGTITLNASRNGSTFQLTADEVETVDATTFIVDFAPTSSDTSGFTKGGYVFNLVAVWSDPAETTTLIREADKANLFVETRVDAG